MELLVQRHLIDKRKNVNSPTQKLLPFLVDVRRGRERLVGVMVVVHRQANLLQIVLGLRASRRFASLLHGRKQQSRSDGDGRRADLDTAGDDSVTFGLPAICGATHRGDGRQQVLFNVSHWGQRRQIEIDSLLSRLRRQHGTELIDQ